MSRSRATRRLVLYMSFFVYSLFQIEAKLLSALCKCFYCFCYGPAQANNPLAPLGMSWIPPAAAADVLRIFLLQRYGGPPNATVPDGAFSKVKMKESRKLFSPKLSCYRLL